MNMTDFEMSCGFDFSFEDHEKIGNMTKKELKDLINKMVKEAIEEAFKERFVSMWDDEEEANEATCPNL